MEDKPHLLIVEDDPGLLKQLIWALKTDYNILSASTQKEAQDLVSIHAPQVIVHDLGLPPDSKGVSEGKASIKSILNRLPETKIIVMTGKGDQDDAIDMIGLGAHDFFSKPVESETLKLIIERAFFLSDLERKSHRVRPADPVTEDEEFVLPGIVGTSQAMKKIAERVKKIAKTTASVFINGESGTGKELIARAINDLSDRSQHSFVAINCAAIPESLLESELFGYEKGAFTGANKTTIGKIEQANGGTLFLDEIGDMAYDLQSKILRFLQERTIQRVGGTKDISVDVRIISATHQNLQDLIGSNQFRQDLYYRINEIEISLPTLIDRDNDLPLIANHLLKKFSQSHGKPEMKFTAEALAAIQQAEWKGNVRELSNQVNKAVILSDSEYITEEDVGLSKTRVSDESKSLYEATLDNIPTLKQAKEKTELKLIVKAMEANNNNVNETAKHLGVTRQRIYSLLKKHNINLV